MFLYLKIRFPGVSQIVVVVVVVLTDFVRLFSENSEQFMHGSAAHEHPVFLMIKCQQKVGEIFF